MRTAIYIVLGTATLLILVVLGVEWWLGAKIRRTAEKEVADRTGGAVKLEIGHVGVCLVSRTVTLKGITLSADTARVGEYLPRVDSLGGEIGKIVLRGVRWRLKGGDKYVSLRTVEILEPRISLVVSPDRDTAAVSDSASPSLRDRIAAWAGKLTVGRFLLSDASIKVANPSRNSYAAKGLTIEADGLSIGPGEAPDPRPLFCDDVRIGIDKASVHFLVTAQLLEAEAIRAGTRDGQLALENIRLIPQYGKAEYAWKVARHTDWTQAIAGSIEARGLDFGRLWRDTVLSIDSLTVKDAEVASYKNRRIVRQEKFKPMLHEMVQGVPFGLEIASVELANAHVVYEELSATGDKPGRITFDSLNGTFRGLTNRTDDPDSMYTLTASGKVMDTGQLRAVFRFPAHPSNDRFEVEGTLGPMNLHAFNRILEPLADAGIHSGRLDGLSFTISGNHKEAKVTMKMRYDDLSVALLREDQDGRKHRRRIVSGLVNLVLIKSSNPDRKGLREVQGAAVRDTTRSQFNYLWKTLLAGVKGSVGFPGAK